MFEGPLCLGGGQFGASIQSDSISQLMDWSFDYGVNAIDTAESYQGGLSQEIIGEYFERTKSRDQWRIVSKFGSPRSTPDGLAPASRENILRSCNASLDRLRTDYIDVFMLHRPDFETSLEESLSGFLELKRAGKILSVGTSGFPAWRLSQMLSDPNWRSLLTVEQAPINALDRRFENELLPMAEHRSFGLMAWSPLAGGLLSGQYSNVVPVGSRLARSGYQSRFGRRVTPLAVERSARFEDIARDAGFSAASMAIRWCLSYGQVQSLALGLRSLDHIREAAAAASAGPLQPEVLGSIDAVLPPGSAATDFHSSAQWYLGSAAAVRNSPDDETC